jgi:hypothetical protein
MYKNDNFVKGFLVGLALNAVAGGIVWLLIEKIGVSLSENTQKLYLLATIPAILFLWYSIKKKNCVKIGMGTLLSVIALVAAFFLYTL